MTMKEVRKLHELCFEVNGMTDRRRSVTGDLPTVFYDYSGHTSTIDIRVHENGWLEDSRADKTFWLHVDRDTNEEYQIAIKYLTDLKNQINKKDRLSGNSKRSNKTA